MDEPSDELNIPTTLCVDMDARFCDFATQLNQDYTRQANLIKIDLRNIDVENVYIVRTPRTDRRSRLCKVDRKNWIVEFCCPTTCRTAIFCRKIYLWSFNISASLGIFGFLKAKFPDL